MPEGQSRWSRDFFDMVEAIRLKDPLAYFLGSMEEGDQFVFKYPDAIKLAGHSCPAVAGAYKLTAIALSILYSQDIPVRGDMRVAIMGRPTDMAYGPMSQVISFITGAAPITGFGGLGRKFGRRSLLVFDEKNFKLNTFIFQRMDNNKIVEITYNPDLIPEEPELGALMSLALSGQATEDENSAFKRAWQEKVRKVLLEDKDIDGLFEVNEISEYQFSDVNSL